MQVPRVVIHGPAHAVAALRAAAGLGRPVLLQSPAGAALSHGAPWFREVLAQARAACPEAACEAVLDCADAPGAALAALRLGLRRVRLGAPPEMLDRLAAMGVLPDRGDAPVLDLLGHPDPEAACRAWLGG